ncbi:hypothetical protein BDN72DRAFT_221141 [Pluteus cervinus]|uniref:Uncharacterized protein n=1 Tax=Pluteus cervinus TaxID=181527 RepID=A0ACD3AH88_9AGAR|nr:hypothetical protein BDN72DRAFT_221141 [Pluteus cervinus]
MRRKYSRRLPHLSCYCLAKDGACQRRAKLELLAIVSFTLLGWVFCTTKLAISKKVTAEDIFGRIGTARFDQIQVEPLDSRIPTAGVHVQPDVHHKSVRLFPRSIAYNSESRPEGF